MSQIVPVPESAIEDRGQTFVPFIKWRLIKRTGQASVERLTVTSRHGGYIFRAPRPSFYFEDADARLHHTVEETDRLEVFGRHDVRTVHQQRLARIPIRHRITATAYLETLSAVGRTVLSMKTQVAFSGHSHTQRSVNKHLKPDRVTRRTAQRLFNHLTVNLTDLFQVKFTGKDNSVGKLGVETEGFRISDVKLCGQVNGKTNLAGVLHDGHVGGNHSFYTGFPRGINHSAHEGKILVVKNGIECKVTVDMMSPARAGYMGQVVDRETRMSRMGAHVQVFEAEIDRIGAGLNGCHERLRRACRRHEFKSLFSHGDTLRDWTDRFAANVMGKKIPLPHRCKEKSGQNMINRKLVRIKVLQVLYAFGREETSDLLLAEKELETSLRKSYDLYHLLLLLPVDIVRQHERMIEIHRRKFVPTEEDINPNLRLVNNRLVAQLAENIALCRYVKDNHLSWNEEPGFIHTLLNKLLESEIYAQYSLSSPDTYESDRNFWRVFFRTFVCDNEEFDAFLEEKSIYWNDDVEIIESFLLKTLKQFKPDSGADFPLMPMYKDEECRDFARRLLDLTILHGEEYRARIDRLLINWNANRVAGMDRIILQMAIAELLNFPSIPVNVTLNEYIEEAKYYSTPKSSFFINGILDAVVRELRAEKLLPFKS